MDINMLLTKYEIKRPVCGAYCGDGWVPLIEKLINDCIKAGWDKDLQQVKEKFGGLRFYIGSANDAVHSLISEAEAMSFNICEECGESAQVSSTGGWLSTLCKNCRAAVGR